MYKPVIIYISVFLYSLPHVAAPHAYFEVYSELQTHYSAACSAGV